MSQPQKFSTCLWFDGDVEAAVKFYSSVFNDVKIHSQMVSHNDWPGGKAGDVILVDFEMGGQRYQALNGGPTEPFNDRVSISVTCEGQAEVDRYWNALTAEGGEEIMCGWLKDKHGLRWQIVPQQFIEMVNDKDAEKSNRVMSAMTEMIKLDVAKLQEAFDG